MSGYWFPMSGAAAVAPRAAGEDERLRLLGRDILFDGDFHVTPDGDWQVIEGIPAIRQWIYHCLITNPGEFKMRPDYGCGVKRYVKEEKTPALKAQLKTQIRTQLLRNKRLQDVLVTVENLADSVPGAEGLLVGVWVTVKGRQLNVGDFQVTERSTALAA
jgi:phage baseplate assembly protein W